MLKLHIEITIQTVSGNIFKCIANEKLLDRNININVNERDYLYVSRYGCVKNNLLYITVKQLYIFKT